VADFPLTAQAYFCDTCSPVRSRPVASHSRSYPAHPIFHYPAHMLFLRKVSRATDSISITARKKTVSDAFRQHVSVSNQ